MPTDENGNYYPPVHRNRPFSIPEINDGPLNTFSRSDVLEGRTPVTFGSGQHADIFTASDLPSTDPRLWPKLWPQAGTLLNVPKVVILSDFIAWPEFWQECVFDFPRDVIGSDSSGHFGNYYYLDQWNQGTPWKGAGSPTSDDNDYRYARTVTTPIQNPSFADHQRFWDAARVAKQILESHPTDPIYVILPNWIPRNDYQLTVGPNWTGWANDNIYWPGSSGEAQTDILGGHSSCDTFHTGGHRGRVRPDPTAPAWRSDAGSPPPVPCLLSRTPYFGTNVLHLWLGHWCQNWGSSTLTDFESWPLSPAGTQIGPILLSTYLGSPNPFFDGRRQVWRDFTIGYGYNGSSVEDVEAKYQYYRARIEAAADEYKQNFWKYRNFGLRFFTWPTPWTISWLPERIFDDQKWCPSQQFYFGFSFEDWAAMVASEDSYAIDYSSTHGDIKFSNTLTRSPDSPSLREAVKVFFPPLRDLVNQYYGANGYPGLNGGTSIFYDKIIEHNGLADYNVVNESRNGIDLTTADLIVEYVRNYFAEEGNA